MLRFFESSAPKRRKGNADMDAETAPKPARPRLNPNTYTKALRRERIFSPLRMGWPYEEIPREERVSERRVRKIVSDALRRQTVDDASDHALLQLVRLEGAKALAAEAIDVGDLKAVAPYLKVSSVRPISQGGRDEARLRRRRAGEALRQDEPHRRPPGGHGSQDAWADRRRPDGGAAEPSSGADAG